MAAKAILSGICALTLRRRQLPAHTAEAGDRSNVVRGVARRIAAAQSLRAGDHVRHALVRCRRQCVCTTVGPSPRQSHRGDTSQLRSAPSRKCSFKVDQIDFERTCAVVYYQTLFSSIRMWLATVKILKGHMRCVFINALRSSAPRAPALRLNAHHITAHQHASR